MTNSRSVAVCPFQPKRPNRPSVSRLTRPLISGNSSNGRRWASSRTSSGTASMRPAPKIAGVFRDDVRKVNWRSFASTLVKDFIVASHSCSAGYVACRCRTIPVTSWNPTCRSSSSPAKALPPLADPGRMGSASQQRHVLRVPAAAADPAERDGRRRRRSRCTADRLRLLRSGSAYPAPRPSRTAGGPRRGPSGGPWPVRHGRQPAQ